MALLNIKDINMSKDEYYTPSYAIKPILKYLNQNMTIWLPFDTKESNFYKVLSEQGHTIINGHISEGKDFFEQQLPENVDCVVSNPPYSKLTEILEKLYMHDVPFALLVSVFFLFDSKKRFELMKDDNNISILYLYPRVQYTTPDGKINKNTMWQSVYLCRKMNMSNQLEFAYVNRNHDTDIEGFCE